MFVPDEGYTRHMSYTQTYKIPMFLLDLDTKVILYFIILFQVMPSIKVTDVCVLDMIMEILKCLILETWHYSGRLILKME